MKMLKTIVLTLLTVLLALSLTACTKERESLSGTVWIGAERGTSMRIIFSQTEFELLNLNDYSGFYGTYAYNQPVVTMIVTKYYDAKGNMKTGGFPITGTITDYTLTLTYTHEGATSTVTFIRQN